MKKNKNKQQNKTQPTIDGLMAGSHGARQNFCCCFVYYMVEILTINNTNISNKMWFHKYNLRYKRHWILFIEQRCLGLLHTKVINENAFNNSCQIITLGLNILKNTVDVAPGWNAWLTVNLIKTTMSKFCICNSLLKHFVVLKWIVLLRYTCIKIEERVSKIITPIETWKILLPLNTTSKRRKITSSSRILK